MVDGEPVAEADDPPRVRLFLAVRPPADVVEAVAELAEASGPGVRWTDPTKLHLTLRFLGPADVDEVIAAIDRIQPLTASEVHLDPVLGRLGQAVVIPARGLEALAGEVRRATAALGRPDDRPFVGHLTIGWLDGAPSDVHEWADPVATSFEVRSLELLSSVPSGGGHRYQVLRSWPLADHEA